MLWNAVSPILRKEHASEAAEPDLAFASTNLRAQVVAAVAYAERESVHNKLDRTALKEFLATTILSSDEITEGKPISGAEFINSCLAASNASVHGNGFSLNELGQHFDGTPTSAAARNIVNALEHCVDIGVLIQNIQNTTEAPRYEPSNELLPQDLIRQQWPSLTPESKAFLQLPLNAVPDIIDLGPPFIDLSVQAYLKLRASGSTMTDLVRATIVDPTVTYYGSPACLLEKIEEHAAALGLITTSQANPRFIESHPEV